MRNDRFNRGSSTYLCDVCGRRTRYTGNQSVGSKLCADCWDLAGLENEVSDGYRTLDETKAMVAPMVAALKAKGGDIAEWEKTFHLNAEG